MCFGKTPTPKAPPPPPTERDANLDGVKDRQRAAAAAKASGLESTIATSSMGVTSGAPTFKPTLGS